MKKKIKAVVDTQIFIKSWFNNKYFYCDALIDLVDKGKLQLLFSQEIIGELFYVTKNFAIYAFDDQEVRLEFLHNVSGMFLDALSVNTSETECPDLNDKTDEMLLKTAIKGEADFIISDDFRSGIHKVDLEGIKIVSSEDFVSKYITLLDN